MNSPDQQLHDESTRPLSNHWPLIIGVVLFLQGAISFLKSYSYYLNGKTKEYEVLSTAIFVVPYYLLWFALAFLVYRIYRRWGLEWKQQIAFAVLVALLHTILNRIAILILGRLFTPEFFEDISWSESIESYARWVFPESLTGLVNYGSFVVIFAAIGFYDRYRNQTYRSLELQEQLTSSQLMALKNQLQPHFLFNTLNTISMMVRGRKNEEAVTMISGLSDLLRLTIDPRIGKTVTLEQELNLLRKYLDIESCRFNDRLSIDFQIEEEIEKAQVPHFLLQPIVENAFKHGIDQSLEAVDLIIAAEKVEDQLVIHISNSGPSLQHDFKEGIGLANTRARLQSLYQEDAEFQIENMPDSRGVRAMIKLPLSI